MCVSPCALSHLYARIQASERYPRFAKPPGGKWSRRQRSREEVWSVAQGYCVKERKKVEIKDPKQVTMKNGRPAIQGVCPDCGTKIFKIGKLE